MPIIALLTDFGTHDWFVASMKAAMLLVNPSATIVDITHDIPAHDIPSAAFLLRACVRDFPRGTVFAGVVDPGVGSKRAIITARAAGYRFVAPDNGMLSWALDHCGGAEVRVVKNQAFMKPLQSATFQGRDIIGPAAARLCAGARFEDAGPVAGTYVRLVWPAPAQTERSVRGEVIHIDRFGNAVTTIGESFRSLLLPGRARLAGAGRDIPLYQYYQEAGEGKVLAVWGSAGFIEISVNAGSAAQKLGMRIGDAIEAFPG